MLHNKKAKSPGSQTVLISLRRDFIAAQHGFGSDGFLVVAPPPYTAGLKFAPQRNPTTFGCKTVEPPGSFFFPVPILYWI
jgi:hypothetical protein